MTYIYMLSLFEVLKSGFIMTYIYIYVMSVESFERWLYHVIDIAIHTYIYIYIIIYI